MTVDPAAEPFRTLRARDDDERTPIELAVGYTGLQVDELAAVGLIASYAGQIENELSWILRWLIGGDRTETWIMTRDLMASSLIDRVREIFKLPDWLEFAERWQADELLLAVKTAMEDRNRVLHGGVSGASLLDRSALEYSVRRNRETMGGKAFYGTHVMPRAELQAIAVRIWELWELVDGLHYQLWDEVHTDPIPREAP